MELWINEFWILLVYVIGTAFGYWCGYKNNLKNTAESVIDSLIEQKYLKTKGYGAKMEILKHTEWCDDQTSG